MNNKIVFGQYYDANSWLHRLDPRTKIISLIIFCSLLFIIDNIFVLLGFTSLLLILIFTTKTPISKFFKSINAMSFIIIYTYIMQLLTNHDGVLLFEGTFNLTVFNIIMIVVILSLYILLSKYMKSFKLLTLILLVLGCFILQYYLNFSPNLISYNIRIYDSGILEGTFIVIRVIDFLFISSLLTLTTKPTEVNCALNKLLKPFRKLGLDVGGLSMTVSVTLRFIPALILEAEKILKSQASRGADFKEVNFFSKVFQLVSLIIPLFVVTHKKAMDLTYAMEARAYVDNKERSSLYQLNYCKSDCLVLIFMLLSLAFAITSRFIF